MANPRFPDAQLGPKPEAETGYDVNDPAIALPVYRGSGPAKPKPPTARAPKIRKKPSAMAEAMRRRIDAEGGES